MRYTATLVVEADSITDAWEKAHEAFPESLSPDDAKNLAALGVVSFSLGGGTQRVEANFLPSISSPTPLARGGVYPIIDGKSWFPTDTTTFNSTQETSE